MSNIQCIQNVTASHVWTAAIGNFSHTITSLSPHPIDEVVVRAINWNGEVADNYIYLIWSNINNDFIGSVVGANLSPNCPQTRIMLRSPLPNVLQFSLRNPRTTDDMPPVGVDTVTGDIVIHLDLISYKR